MRVLVVCTGNLCRSPVAQRLLWRTVPDGVEVDSAGTRAVVGEGVDAKAAAQLERLGGTAYGHSARQFEPVMADRSDFILTATREHRKAVLEFSPRALHRTFTLLEAAAIDGTGIPGDSVAERIREMARRRPLSSSAFDLDDPIGASDAVHRAVADTIASAVWRVTALIRQLTA